MSLRPEVEKLLEHTGVTVMPKKDKPPKQIPQVYVSIEGGVGEVMTTRGEVDVVFIDWDNVTPDSWDGDTWLLETIEEAMKGSLRLPKQTALGNLRDIDKWLEMFIDPDSGYTEEDEFREEALELLKTVRGKITDLEMHKSE